ncbi:MAG: lamin tail domain-containing protein, partial [Acidimicrobiales bacterium]
PGTDPGPVDPAETPTTAGVRIVAALVDPTGDDPGLETITLLNARPEEVSLAGWTLANATGATFDLGGPVAVGPGDTVRISLTRKLPLSNKGGTVSLFDHEKTLVHGVAYTRDQVSAEGWTITF